MNTPIKTPIRGILFLTAVALFAWFSPGIAIADEEHHHHEAWSHDEKGYWDDHDRYQTFVVHEHHHGYWRVDNGTRVFINID
jgi:hypothetical protein